MREKKSTNYYIEIPQGISKDSMHSVVERAVESVGLYISHIGKYMAHKHPGSVHWHFKREKGERGIVDATFYDEESLFWLMIAHRSPDWVQVMAPKLKLALEKEIALLNI